MAIKDFGFRFADLEAALGHRFADPGLLRDALTHPSLATAKRKRSRGPASPYQRLEFLGDRVVGLAVAGLLFDRYPGEAEGELARRHAALVCQDTLAEVAVKLGLDDAIRLCEGTVREDGRHNPSILADACEAVMGALYADAGFETARAFIARMWEAPMASYAAPPRDPKTSLQEWAQGRGHPLPEYRLVSQEGPSHAPRFRVAVGVEGLGEAEAEGPSKRAAERSAAEGLLARLHDREAEP